MANIATVAAITGNGTVFAVDAQGASRQLKVGDILQKGETVRTVGDAHVELLMDDGHLLAVAPAQSVRLDENVVESDQRPTAQDSAVTTPATADTIIQALERGTDLSTQLEATAAGLGGGGGSDGGSTFVQLLRITEGVDGQTYNYSFTPPDLPPDLQTIPETTTTTTLQLSADPSVFEGSPGVTYTATLGTAGTSDMTVTLSNGAVIVIPAGSTVGTVLVPVQGDDVYKDGETLQANVSTVQGGNFTTITVDDSSVITVVNDTIDTTAAKVSVSVVDGEGDVNNVIEGNQLTFRFSVDHAPQTDLVLNVTIGGVEQTVKIAAGTLQTDVTVDSRPDENYHQGASTVTGTVNSVSPTSDGNYENLTIVGASATATIVDDSDVTTVSISTSDVTENTGGVVTFNVDLSNAPQAGSPATATVQVAGEEGTRTVTLDATGHGSFTVDTHGADVYIDPAAVTATVTAITGGNFEATSVAGATATANVTDVNDTTTVSVSTNDVTENDAGVTFSITLSNPPQGEATAQVQVGETTYDVAIGADGKGTLFIATADPDVYKDPDSITATVTGVSGGNFEAVSVDGATATAQIADTIDNTTVTLAGPDVVAEGAPVTYTVTLSSAAEGPVTVTLSNGETITIADQAVSGSVTVSTEGFEGAALPTVTILSAAGGNFENLVPQGTVNTDIDSVPTVNVVGINGDIGAVDEGALPGGNLGGTLTSSGTFPIDTGSDTLASLVVGGVNVTNGGTVEGANGTLVVTNGEAGYSWTYTLTSPTTDGAGVETDNFSVVVTDSDGDTASAPLVIAINDDVPQAANDAASPAEDTPITINVFANDAAGADGVNLATGVALGTGPTQGTVVYNSDGTFTYTPTAGKEGSDSFTYIITDKDGDQSAATVNITLAPDSTPTVGVVYANEAGGVVNEGALPGGNLGGTVTTSGTLPITTDNDTLAKLEVGGVDVTHGGTVTNTNGTLVVTETNGAYSWTYTLSSPTTDVANVAETNAFAVKVTDSDGDTASSTLTVTITDDVPVSVADGTQALTEDGTQSVNGNVLANDGYGADGAGTFAWDANTAAQTALATYGTLTLNADGTYSFVLNNASAAVQSLTAQSAPIEQTLTYTITDADGDQSQASVTITISGADDTAQVTVAAEGADSTVYEAGLTSVGNTSETDADSFQVAASDGIKEVVVGGTTFTLAQLQDASYLAAHPIATGEGTLTVTGYSSTDGDKSATISYSYTLGAAQTHDQPLHDTTLTDSVSVTVNGVGGTTDTASLSINIVDDVPTASNYTGATFAEGTGAHTIGDAVTLLGISAGADGLQGTLQGITFTNGGTTGGTLSIDGAGQLVYSAPASVSSSTTMTETFSYTVTDGDGDTVTKQVTFGVSDTGITAVSASSVSVDEDSSLSGGNAGGTGDLVTPVPTGHLSYTLGADALGSITLSATTGLLKLDGTTAVSTSWDAGTKTLTGYGTSASDVVFTIALSNVNATGADYTLTLLQPVKHLGDNTEDDKGFTVNVSVKDVDNSEGTTSFGVTIDDDTPVISASNLGIANVAGTYDGHYAFAVGADTQTFANSFDATALQWNNPRSGFHLEFDAAVSNSGTRVYDGVDSFGAKFFTVAVKQDGTYSFDLVNPDPVTTTSVSSLLAGIAGGSGLASYTIDSTHFGGAFNLVLTGYSDGSGKNGVPHTADTLTISATQLGVGDDVMQGNSGDILRFDVQQVTPNASLATLDVHVATTGGFKATDSADLTIHYTTGSDVTSAQVIGTDQLLHFTFDTSRAVDWIEIKPDSSSVSFKIDGVGLSYSVPSYPSNYHLDFSLTGGDGDQDHASANFTVAVNTTDTSSYTIHGTAGADDVYGTTGSDALWGDGGSDTFVWHLADSGSGTLAAVDTVKDFGSGDTLKMPDLLTDTGNGLSVTGTSSGNNTTLHIVDATHDQTIVLEGYVTADNAAAQIIADALKNTGHFTG